jgi:hypothetical protein
MKSARDRRLVREIAWSLAIKLALLFALWLAFFSHPRDRELTPAEVGSALLGGATTADPSAAAAGPPPTRSEATP